MGEEVTEVVASDSHGVGEAVVVLVTVVAEDRLGYVSVVLLDGGGGGGGDGGMVVVVSLRGYMAEEEEEVVVERMVEEVKVVVESSRGKPYPCYGEFEQMFPITLTRSANTRQGDGANEWTCVLYLY